MGTTTDLMNTVGASISGNQELKNKLGRIVLIAAAAIIAVILIGIIVIINTRKKSDEYLEENAITKKNKLNKEDFTVAVNEDEAYRELEKLADLHNKNNGFNEEIAEEIVPEEIVSEVNEVENKDSLENYVNDSMPEEIILEEEKIHNIYEENKNDFLKGFESDLETDNKASEEPLGVTEKENTKHKKAKGKRFK